MLSFDATQLAIVAAANKDEISWLFQIDRTGNDVIDDYWSTKVKTWDGDNYTFKIAGFDAIEMNRAQSESGIQAPSSFDFMISNKDNTLVPSDFSGGNATLMLVISAGGSEAEIRRWNFDIKSIAPGYQTLSFHCVDWLQKYLDGDYPNTPLIPYIFPESLQKDKICVPVIFGKPCIPVVPVIKNLITNGYMELDSNWANYGSPTTNERSDAHVYEGEYSRHVVPAASGDTGIKSDTFTTEDGKTYTLDFWVYNPTYGGAANGMVMGKIRKGDNSGWVSYSGQTWKPFVTSWNTWTHFQWHFTEGAATGGAGAYVVFHYIVAQPFYVDQVFVGKSKYLLGAKIADPTDYVVDELSTPRDWDGDHQIWSKDNFTFDYTHEEGADGNDYAFCECIAADQDGDGTLDSNITFKSGQRYLPAGAWYTRSDTIDKTSPADILDYILQDWGIPSARIDATTLAAVKAIYSGWGLTWNMGLWTYEKKNKLLARLLLMCHTELIVRDKIYFKVHSKTSQKTLTKAEVLKTADVGEGTFEYDLIESKDTKDSAYVTFQKKKGCLDNLLAALTTAKGSTDYIADDEISADYIQDSQDAQRVGTLALQRLFLSEAKITCDTKGTCLALECDDVITLNHADYGGNYDVLIDSFCIKKDASIGIEATKFSQALDDWGDLSPVAVTITQMPDLNSYGTVISGPDCLAGQYIGNVLPGRLRIGMTGNHILFDPVEPIQTFVEGGVTRMKIGDLGTDDYGIEFLDHSGNSIFKLDGSGVNTLSGFYLGLYDFWGGNAAIDNAATVIVLGNLDGTPKIALGATADAITFAGSQPGFIVTGDGDVRFGGATHGLKFDHSTGILSVSDKVKVGSGTYIDIDGGKARIRSSNYVTGMAGAGFTLEPDLLEVGNIAARGIIRTAVFQKDIVSAIGGNFVVLPADVLATDMTAADASTLTIEGNETFAVGDFLRIKDDTNDEWFEITSIASAPTYAVTRDKDAQYAADTNPAWKKGATVVNYGASGQGFVFMTASESNAPYLSVATHAGAPWDTINTKVRLGNLNGYAGYVADIYGLALYEDADNYLLFDPTNGIRISVGAADAITIKNGSDIKIEDGGDIKIYSSSGSSGTIEFHGNDYTIYAGAYYSNSSLCFWPDTAGQGQFWVGANAETAVIQEFYSIHMYSAAGIDFKTFVGGTYTTLYIQASGIKMQSSYATPAFYPNSTDDIDIGKTDKRWKHGYFIDLTVTNCITEGTCEIIPGDALAIIDDIVQPGSGIFDEWEHERFDMARLEPKYPWLFVKDEGERYLERIGTKSDLLYKAVLQLDERLKNLEE